MPKIITTIILLLTLVIACSENSPVNNGSEQYKDNDYVYDPNDYYYVAEPLDWENYYYAEFGLYLPESRESIKGILVLVPGHNGNGLYTKDNPEWRAVADRNNLALVGCYYYGNHSNKQYYLAGGGSGFALVTALENFAEQTGLEDLRTLPIFIRGYSDGAVFAYTFTCNIPQRIAGFVAVKGGYFPFIADEVAVNTPGMFIYGEDDLETRNTQSQQVFINYRKENDAQWLLLEHKNYGHELGNENDIVIPFIDIVCDLRMNSLTHQLNVLVTEDGYLANQIYENYWTYSDYPYDKDYAGWLPNEEFAVIWKSYVETL